jgi:putative endonuclease
MFYLYILQSETSGDLFFDIAEDINRAVEDHLIGLISTTKDHLPLRLVYYETFQTEEQAKARYEELTYSEEAGKALMEKLKAGFETDK